MHAGSASSSSTAREHASRSSGPSWSWGDAALGATYALPAAVVALGDPTRGLALAVGVLPAALIGLAPARRARIGIAAAGVLIGVPMLISGLLAGVPVLAVAMIALLGPATALLAARSRIGQITMVLSLPMLAVGLSYTDIGQAAGLAGLMIVGSAFACAISMLWPETTSAGHAPRHCS